MSLKRRSPREVLRDKRGIATSFPEAIGGVTLQTITMTAIGTVLAGAAVFWAVTSASADTSSQVQSASVAFEKAVKASDVVEGIDTNRVGLLRDLPDDKCEVQTWQDGSRDGKTTLTVDTTTVDGVCTPTTTLSASGSTDASQELLFNIKTPAFSYSNLGGREITFNGAGTVTLTTGAKPAGVKTGDWEDTRPYKVSLDLQTLDQDNITVTRKAVMTGYTNVVNVTQASDEQRYVPTPSDAPIPGPLTITGVKRSTTTGTAYAGAREGVSVTFAGGVCAAVPSKVTVSYTQQSPSTAPVVSTVLNSVLTGGSTTVDLGEVPNGSTGAIEVAAKCVDDGVVVKDTKGFTQDVPATELTAKQNTDSWKHDLTWTKVSSLPTQFEVRRSFEGDPSSDELMTTTDELSYQSVYDEGANLGMTSNYFVVAIVGDTRSPAATASVTTPLPKPEPTKVTPASNGATWTAVACPAFSTPQYAYRYYQQTGTSTTVKWSELSEWSTARSATGVQTPAYGRTVFEVHARCVATKSDAVSPASVSEQVSAYKPEAIKMSVARSTTVGTAYAGAREGIVVMTTGGRCYGNSPVQMDFDWYASAPANVADASLSRTFTASGSVDSTNIAGVPNGTVGTVEVEADCTLGKTNSSSAEADYTQTLPTPTVTVKQGADAETHNVSWNDLSSLPVTFTSYQNSASSATDVAASKTTALSKTYSYADGGTYGNAMDYSVLGVVGDVTSARAANARITTPWPTVPGAKSIKYTRSSSGDFVDGTVTWSWDRSCPAGTVHGWRLLENRTGARNGTIDTTVRSSMDWSYAGASYRWAPDYATEGYAYGVRVDGICKSNVTGYLTNSYNDVQSSNWVTAMQTPKAPVWDAYNYQEMKRGTNWTYNTPLNQNFQTMSVDYITYCSNGAEMDWSSFTSRSWAGNDFYHPIGYRDYWQLPDGVNSATVTYYNAKYNCSTPWATSAQSPAGANKVVTVRR